MLSNRMNEEDHGMTEQADSLARLCRAFEDAGTDTYAIVALLTERIACYRDRQEEEGLLPVPTEDERACVDLARFAPVKFADALGWTDERVAGVVASMVAKGYGEVENGFFWPVDATVGVILALREVA